MTRSYVFYVISGLLFAYGFFPYIRSIISGPTTPRILTWFVWLVGDAITLGGMIAKDTINGVMLIAVLGAGTVFVLSLFY